MDRRPVAADGRSSAKRAKHGAAVTVLASEGSSEMDVDGANDSGIALDDLPEAKVDVKQLFASTLAALPAAPSQDSFTRAYPDTPNPVLVAQRDRVIGLPFSADAKWMSSTVKTTTPLHERLIPVQAHNPAWKKWLETTQNEVAKALGVMSPIDAFFRGAICLSPSNQPRRIESAELEKSFGYLVVALPSFCSTASAEIALSGVPLTSVALGAGLPSSATTVVSWFRAGTDTSFICTATDKPQLLLLFELSLQDLSLPLPIPSGWTRRVRDMQRCIRQFKAAYQAGNTAKRICHYLEGCEADTLAELTGQAGEKARLLQEVAKQEGLRLHYFKTVITITGSADSTNCAPWNPSLEGTASVGGDRMSVFDHSHVECLHHAFSSTRPRDVSIDVVRSDSECRSLAGFVGKNLEFSQDELCPRPALSDFPASQRCWMSASNYPPFRLEHVYRGGILALWPEAENDKVVLVCLKTQQLVDRIVENIHLRKSEFGGRMGKLSMLFEELAKRSVRERQGLEKKMYEVVGEGKDGALFKEMVKALKSTTDSFDHIGSEQLTIYLATFDPAEVRPLLDDMLGSITSTNLGPKLDFLISARAAVDEAWRKAAYLALLSKAKHLLGSRHGAALVSVLQDVGEPFFQASVMPLLPSPQFHVVKITQASVAGAPASSKLVHRLWGTLIIDVWTTHPATARQLLDRGTSTMPIDSSTPESFVGLVQLAMRLKQLDSVLPVAFMRLDQALVAHPPTLHKQVETYKTTKRLFKEHAERGETVHRMVLSMLDGLKGGIIARATITAGTVGTAAKLDLAFLAELARAANALSAPAILSPLAAGLAPYRDEKSVTRVRLTFCQTLLDYFGARTPRPPAVVKILQDTLQAYVALVGDEPTADFLPLAPLRCTSFECDSYINPFLLNGAVRQYQYHAKLSDRRHVEDLILSRPMTDLATETIKSGSPHTLVITKTGNLTSSRAWREEKRRRVTDFVKQVAPTETVFTELFTVEQRDEFVKVCGAIAYQPAVVA